MPIAQYLYSTNYASLEYWDLQLSKTSEAVCFWKFMHMFVDTVGTNRNEGTGEQEAKRSLIWYE